MFWLLPRRSPHQTSRYTVFVNIDSTTNRVMYAHGVLPFSQEDDVLFLHDSVTPSCRFRGTLSAKTIPDSVNVVWSISSAGLTPPLSLSDSASPDPSRLKPTAYRLPLFMLAGDGSFMGISSNFKIPRPQTVSSVLMPPEGTQFLR